MPESPSNLPLNALRVFVEVARLTHVSRAATAIGISQSAVSRHLSVLESYIGTPLIERHGRNIRLTEAGRQLSAVVSDPLDEIALATKIMRQKKGERTGLTVVTSLPTFAFATLIPRISEFSDAHGGVAVDVLTSTADRIFRNDADVLVTRELRLPEPMVEWKLMDETVVCVCGGKLRDEVTIENITAYPLQLVTSRPDILPKWLGALGLDENKVTFGPRYDHHYLAIPAVLTGQAVLIAPKIVVNDYLKNGLMRIVEGSTAHTGMSYRAFASDRARQVELSHAFCKWLSKICKSME